MNTKQSLLFKAISESGELIFALTHNGISANIIGHFRIQYYEDKKEHRLEINDGIQHVHIDWERVKFVEHSLFYGEGVLTFKEEDKGSNLFKLYKFDGAFSAQVQALMGDL